MNLRKFPLLIVLVKSLLILFVLGCSETSQQNNLDQISLPNAEDEKTTAEKDPGTKPLESDSGDISTKPELESSGTSTVESEQLQVPQSSESTPTPSTEVEQEASEENLLLTQLNSIVIEPENESLPYERSKFPHWDDEDGDGMNTRLEILFIEKVQNLGWYSRWDGEWYRGEGGLSAPRFDIDHIVSLKEAWRSGADEWSASDRDAFADDELNLTAVTASSNRSKGAKDASEWIPSEPSGQCYFLVRVIQVKIKWNLSIDQAEYTALNELIDLCGPEIPAIPAPPSEISSSFPASTPSPLPVQLDEGYGNQFYRTADGTDIDLYDANTNGDINCGELPSATRPVIVISPGSDPYRLDADGDGVGCES